MIISIGPDGIPNTADDVVMSGTPGAPLNLDPSAGGTEPSRTSHSFLDDIAHNAVPVLDTSGALAPDGVLTGVDPAGNAVQFDPLTGSNLEYDNELLDSHFVTGDGRGNENIGLTAVHHVFHSEHNRQVAAQQLEILKSGDAVFINEWLLTDLTETEVAALPTDSAGLRAYAETLSWDGERLFQAARFATEMQYQHLVFEEFGRKVQPMIDVFVFNTITDIDPAIFSEFANVVYRFGHSMLTEDIARMFLNEDGQPIVYDENGVAQVVSEQLTEDNWGNDIGLIEAFLNPVEYDLGGDDLPRAGGGRDHPRHDPRARQRDRRIHRRRAAQQPARPAARPGLDQYRARPRHRHADAEPGARAALRGHQLDLRQAVRELDGLRAPTSRRRPRSSTSSPPTARTRASLPPGDDVADRRAAATLLVLGGERRTRRTGSRSSAARGSGPARKPA